MQKLLCSALAGTLLFAPGAALAQMIFQEPAMVVQEPGTVVQEMMIVGPIGVEDARAIAMMNGLVTVEDVNTRWRDGDFEVEGEDASGNHMEIRIDAETGAVLEIDD
jgi:hypothetical protein